MEVAKVQRDYNLKSEHVEVPQEEAPRESLLQLDTGQSHHSSECLSKLYFLLKSAGD